MSHNVIVSPKYRLAELVLANLSRPTAVNEIVGTLDDIFQLCITFILANTIQNKSFESASRALWRVIFIIMDASYIVFCFAVRLVSRYKQFVGKGGIRQECHQSCHQASA
jgi:hypothetical protein